MSNLIDLTETFNAKRLVNRVIQEATILHSMHLLNFSTTGDAWSKKMAGFYGNILSEFEPVVEIK